MAPIHDGLVYQVMAIDSRGHTVASTFAFGADEISEARQRLRPLAERIAVMPLAPHWRHARSLGLPDDVSPRTLRDALLDAKKEAAHVA